MKYKTDDNGTKFEIAEPWLTATDDILIASNSPIDFLSLSPFQSTELKAADEFVELYLQMVNAIKEKEQCQHWKVYYNKTLFAP